MSSILRNSKKPGFYDNLGGAALFRTSGFLPGRAGTGKRMQYRPQENTSGIPLYG